MAQKKIVVVGGGVSGHLMLKALGSSEGFEITMITAQPYKECPWSGPLALAFPEVVKF